MEWIVVKNNLFNRCPEDQLERLVKVINVFYSANTELETLNSFCPSRFSHLSCVKIFIFFKTQIFTECVLDYFVCNANLFSDEKI